PDPTVELPRHPADVGRVVLAQRKGNAEIEEIEQPALAFEETKEAVSAPWIPRRDEIAQRMMLYVGPVEEHLRLPAWSGLPFEKQHGPGPAHLLQRDGEADIGRPEPDSNEVVHHIRRPVPRAQPPDARSRPGRRNRSCCTRGSNERRAGRVQTDRSTVCALRSRS